MYTLAFLQNCLEKKKKGKRKVEEIEGEVFTVVGIGYTVKPPNRGHFGDWPLVPCREVVLFSEVLF